jgi:hypothetical protein
VLDEFVTRCEPGLTGAYDYDIEGITHGSARLSRLGWCTKPS